MHRKDIIGDIIKKYNNFEKLNCQTDFDIFNDPSKVQLVWK